MADQAKKAAVCDHFFISHHYNGMAVRICQFCQQPDWDDLRAELALAWLRVQLFGAMQVLKGEDLVDFWKLIDEVNEVRPLYQPSEGGR
jgi:hypothetical protein